VFCRNVLIYFDHDTKASIFERVSRVMEPDGILLLGAAESVVGISDAFKPYPERRGLYNPNPNRAPRPYPAPKIKPALKAVAAAAR
jgi:chemotaxis protein methyltransferase CheR